MQQGIVIEGEEDDDEVLPPPQLKNTQSGSSSPPASTAVATHQDPNNDTQSAEKSASSPPKSSSVVGGGEKRKKKGGFGFASVIRESKKSGFDSDSGDEATAEALPLAASPHPPQNWDQQPVVILNAGSSTSPISETPPSSHHPSPDPKATTAQTTRPVDHVQPQCNTPEESINKAVNRSDNTTSVSSTAEAIFQSTLANKIKTAVTATTEIPQGPQPSSSTANPQVGSQQNANDSLTSFVQSLDRIIQNKPLDVSKNWRAVMKPSINYDLLSYPGTKQNKKTTISNAPTSSSKVRSESLQQQQAPARTVSPLDPNSLPVSNDSLLTAQTLAAAQTDSNAPPGTNSPASPNPIPTSHQSTPMSTPRSLMTPRSASLQASSILSMRPALGGKALPSAQLHPIKSLPFVAQRVDQLFLSTFELKKNSSIENLKNTETILSCLSHGIDQENQKVSQCKVNIAWASDAANVLAEASLEVARSLPPFFYKK